MEGRQNIKRNFLSQREPGDKRESADMSVQNHLGFRDSDTGQADNSGGPLTALNTSAGAHPNYCVLQGIPVGGGCCRPYSQICVRILGKNQLWQWCGEGLESVQFSDIMVASVFADDVVLLASSDSDLWWVLAQFAADCGVTGRRAPPHLLMSRIFNRPHSGGKKLLFGWFLGSLSQPRVSQLDVKTELSNYASSRFTDQTSFHLSSILRVGLWPKDSDQENKDCLASCLWQSLFQVKRSQISCVSHLLKMLRWEYIRKSQLGRDPRPDQGTWK